MGKSSRVSANCKVSTGVKLPVVIVPVRQTVFTPGVPLLVPYNTLKLSPRERKVLI